MEGLSDAVKSNQNVWDKYNGDPASQFEVKQLLVHSGWEPCADGIEWTRPGKDIENGASGKFLDPRTFMNFSPRSGLEIRKPYRLFDLFCIYKYKGDRKLASQEINRRYNEKEQAVNLQTTFQIDDGILELYRIDPDEEVEDLKPILKIRQIVGPSTRDVPVFMPGDLSMLTGRQKSKKTYFTAMICTALMKGSFDGKLIGSMLPEKNRVAYFDTEQGEHYARRTAKMIQRISNTKEFDYFCLRKCSFLERRAYIEDYLTRTPECGFLVIDQIADLLKDFNDYPESLAFAQWLLKLTAVHNIHCLTILHQNKGDTNARGHLGTVMSQKVETVIQIEKFADEPSKSLVSAKDTRGPGFDEFAIEIDGMGNPHIILANNA